jgi:hypothetical protein
MCNAFMPSRKPICPHNRQTPSLKITYTQKSAFRLAKLPYNTPSCSPGSLLTRFCSQLSRSLAASFCKSTIVSHTLSSKIANNDLHRKSQVAGRRSQITHVVLLFHINPAPVFPNPKLLFLCHRFHFPVVALVSQRCRGCEEEAAEQHCADEGQAEEREWVFG